jgi:glycosyltransferase involved in cell wall biosynthesis
LKKKITIAFVTSSSPLDKKSWSGIYYQMYNSLQNNIEKVECIGPIPLFFMKAMAITNRITKFFCGKGYNYKNSIILGFIHSKYIQFKLGNKKFDYIFAPAASTEVAFLNTNIPIIYTSDSSFGQLNEYYDTYSNLFTFSVKESNFIEQRGIQKAKFITYPSNWAKSYVDNNYIKNALTQVIPFGANINKEQIHYHPKKISKKDQINLLFLGVDWYRKGGDIVYESFLQLIEKGYNVSLIICGCIPPVVHKKIKVFPFLDKNKKDDLVQLTELFSQAHFLFLPSKAECFGIVFCEASAFGVPSITRNTGGISNAVKNGINGYCLDENANPENYTLQIQELIENEKEYEKLSLSSRKLYEDELNWEHWAKAVVAMLDIK